jgi:quercetin dioxygenase-like cupin family protein
MDAQLLNTHPTGTTSGTAHRPPYAHSGQALTFDLANEIHHLHQEEIWMRNSHNARTLYKDHDLRMVLIAMKAGACLDEHIVAGRLAIQVLSGQLRLRVPGQSVDLPAGRLMALDYAVHYEIEAEEESAFLLTVAYTTQQHQKI